MLRVSTRGNPAKFVVMGRSSLTQECVLNSSKPLLRTLSPPQFPQNNVASLYESVVSNFLCRNISGPF